MEPWVWRLLVLGFWEGYLIGTSFLTYKTYVSLTELRCTLAHKAHSCPGTAST